jgi:hypothetical protein
MRNPINAECERLYRVPSLGHSANNPFAECFFVILGKHASYTAAVGGYHRPPSGFDYTSHVDLSVLVGFL